MKLIIFNHNLRIFDNPPLFSACQKSHQDQQKILPIFIFDEINQIKIGAASKWFLHFALMQLQKDLKEHLGLELMIFKGDNLEILSQICQKEPIKEIYYQYLFEPKNTGLQKSINNFAKENQIDYFAFKSYLIFDPDKIKNQSSSYFKVFTPFWKNCLKNWDLVKKPLSLPKISVKSSISKNFNNCLISDLNLLPKNPNWAEKFGNLWPFNRNAILKNFNNFLKNHLKNYQENRNFLDQNATSKLSPYLHFGLVSVNEIIDLVKNQNPQDKIGTSCFLSEIGWREFSHHLLYHFPDLVSKNFKPQFDNFPWQNNPQILKKWQKGQTGYPIIDAAMQELLQSGFMHNRARMIVASFLTKNLLIDWKKGEEYFWDCLIDANQANNCASWQWVAGSGADAAPYFRIFNPILQAEKFDPDGKYVKKWLPILKKVPPKFIHQPWKLDKEQLAEFEVILGKNYPNRIIDLNESRNRALEAYKNLAP